MVFSDTTNKTGLVEDADFICGTDSTSYPLADKARNGNRHYYLAVSDILKSQGRVTFDDSNLGNSTFYHQFNLTDGVSTYALPTNLLRVDAVEIKDLAGNYFRIKNIGYAEKSHTVTDFEDNAGTPWGYQLYEDYIVLSPAPSTNSVTLTNGCRIWYQREIDAFTAADTTQEPGFAEPYHRIISLGMAHDFLVVNGPSAKADRVLQQYTELRMEMKQFYTKKNSDSRPKVRPIHNPNLYR
jgi:hypothetical protein